MTHAVSLKPNWACFVVVIFAETLPFISRQPKFILFTSFNWKDILLEVANEIDRIRK